MHMIDPSIYRRLFTALVFSVTFLLTPSAMLTSALSGGTSFDGSQSASDVSRIIPVQMLEESQECLWCTPMEPVNCPAGSTTPDQARHQDDAPQLWLNPDTIPKSQTTPCIKQSDSDAHGPNA